MSNGLPYNGWPKIVRHGRDKHYYHAREKGVLPLAKECLGCKEKFERLVPYHAEEYGPTLEDYWASRAPLCHRSHAMLHARFTTPNRWKQYVSQASAGQIDEAEYPNCTHIAALLSRFKNRSDIPNVEMANNVPEYFRSLSFEEYIGPAKVATLLVFDLATQTEVEVPDWTIYGLALEKMSPEERETLLIRGVDADAFLAKHINLPCNAAGNPIYRRLYLRMPKNS